MLETLTNTTLFKANKEHSCSYCTHTIYKGEMYQRSVHKYEGDIYTWKSHLECNKIAHDLDMFNYADEGVTADFFQETIRYEYEKIMRENFKEQYESKDFVDPKFREQLEFVIKFRQKQELCIK